MINQNTIKNEITISGIGQHKGTINTLILSPASENTGIVFDLKGEIFKLNIDNVVGTGGFTFIGNPNSNNLKTIEHLMSAVCGVGIDNLIIKTNDEEVPIMDGSGIEFVKLLNEKAGVFKQNAKRKYLKIIKKVEYSDDNASVSLSPTDDNYLTLDVQIEYENIKPIGIQKEVIKLTPENYMEKIASARTFARLSDVEYLHSKGLCLGASLKTGIAVDEEKIINPEGLRFKNEFVFHKILDAVGDLFVAGNRIIGVYKSIRGGHTQNNMLVKQLLSDKSNYELVEL